MPFEHIKNKDQKLLTFETIFTQTISSGQLGVGLWDFVDEQLTLYEDIVNQPHIFVESLEEYIRLIAFEQDLELALTDLRKFMEDPSSDYVSNFRMKTSEGDIKWVLLKGRMITLEHNAHKALLITFYDVTGNQFQSGNDMMTNLLNRNFFLEKLDSTLQASSPKDKHAVITFHFQNMPDFYNYNLRRAILQKVAGLLLTTVVENTEIAKYPGERFAILIQNYENQASLEAVTNKITALFKRPIRVYSRNILLDIRIGVAQFPEDTTNAVELLMFSELATSQSILSDVKRTTFFNGELGDSFYRRLLIENELVKAVDRNEFYLVFQPQINSQSDELIGIEVLLRWENKRLGLVSPSEFIPIAEKNGQIIDIGYFMIEQAILTASHWLEKDYPFEQISLNISPAEFLDPDFFNQLLSICDQYDFPYEKIELEITEGIYMDSVEDSVCIINQLLGLGFSIAVDDFGTGYSNFAFLIEAKMTTLKIDRSLIQDLDKHSNQLLIKGMIQLAQSLDYFVLAEGVETAEQVELLNQFGCTQVQGYFYSEPLPQPEIEEWMITQIKKNDRTK